MCTLFEDYDVQDHFEKNEYPYLLIAWFVSILDTYVYVLVAISYSKTKSQFQAANNIFNHRYDLLKNNTRVRFYQSQSHSIHVSVTSI